MRSKRLAACAVAALALLLGGCASSQRATPPPVPNEAFAVHTRVGTVVSVDETSRTAIVRLEDGNLTPPPPQAALLARDPQLEPVAVVLPLDMRQGRFFAVSCEEGELRVGDGIFLPPEILEADSAATPATQAPVQAVLPPMGAGQK